MAPIVSTPTVLPGVTRKRISVSPADLTRLFPGATPRTAARAARLVDGFVEEGARDQHVASWGQAAQKRYVDLVSGAQEVSQTDVVGRTHGYIGRIAHLLEAIDIETICNAGRSPLFGLLSPASERIDTPRKLAAVRTELAHLVHLTRDALASLLDLKASLDEHSRRIDEAGLEIEAAALSALFLSEHLTTSQPGLSRRFLQREMSLTKTALQIRGGQLVRDGQVEEPLALVATIQDVVLLLLPEWLAALASARAARYRLNPTQAGELQHRLRTLLRKLEP